MGLVMLESLNALEKYKIIREEYRKGDHKLIWVYRDYDYDQYHARLVRGKLGVKIKIRYYGVSSKLSRTAELYTETNPIISGFHRVGFSLSDKNYDEVLQTVKDFCQEEYLKFLAGVKNS